MGVEAAKALRARQRQVAARIDRLITKHHQERGPLDGARRERIKTAVRDGRRALRARDTAQAAVNDAEVRAGAALARITAEGVSLNDAIAALGLSKCVGRRLARAAEDSTRPLRSTSSTDPAGGSASGAPAGHGEPGTAIRACASAKGSC